MPLLIAARSRCLVCYTWVPLSTASTILPNGFSDCSSFVETRSRGSARSSKDDASKSPTTVSCRPSWCCCLECRRALFLARCCFCCIPLSCSTLSHISALSVTRTPTTLKCTSVLRPRRHRPLFSAFLVRRDVHMDDKSPLEGARTRSRDPFLILRSLMISLERLKLESLNFAHGWTISSPSFRLTKRPKRSVVRVTVRQFQLT